MKEDFFKKYIKTISITAFLFSLTANSLIAGKGGQGGETDDHRPPTTQKQTVTGQANEEAQGESAQKPLTLHDIKAETPFGDQIAQFNTLINAVRESTAPHDEKRTALESIQTVFMDRVEHEGGIVCFNTSWTYPDGLGRRIKKGFLEKQQIRYQMEAVSAQEEERTYPAPQPDVALKSEYLQALAEAYGPSRVERLRTEKPDLFESAGLWTGRYTALKSPRTLIFPLSDPTLAPLWEQIKPVLQNLYGALGNNEDVDSKGPVFLESQARGFPYNDQDLQSFEAFKLAYAKIPRDQRYPVRTLTPEAPTTEPLSLSLALALAPNPPLVEQQAGDHEPPKPQQHVLEPLPYLDTRATTGLSQASPPPALPSPSSMKPPLDQPDWLSGGTIASSQSHRTTRKGLDPLTLTDSKQAPPPEVAHAATPQRRTSSGLTRASSTGSVASRLRAHPDYVPQANKPTTNTPPTAPAQPNAFTVSKNF